MEQKLRKTTKIKILFFFVSFVPFCLLIGKFLLS